MPSATNYDVDVAEEYAREDVCVFEEAAPVYIGKPSVAAEVFVEGSVEQKLFKCEIRRDICLALGLITQAEYDSYGNTCVANDACKEQVVVRGVTLASGRRRVQEGGTRRRLQSAATVDVALIPAGGTGSLGLQAAVANGRCRQLGS